MHVTVEHPYVGIPLFIHPVLAVIAEDGIMAEDYFAAVVPQFSVGTDPLEAGRVEILCLPEPVVVSGDQAQDSVQAREHLVGFGGTSPGKVSQDHHLIPGSYLLIPFPDHIFV